MDPELWPTLALPKSPLELYKSVEGFFLTGFSLPVNQLQNIISGIAIGLEKINMDLDEGIVTLELIQEAYNHLQKSPDVIRTPVLLHVQSLFSHEKKHSSLSELVKPGNCCDLSNIDLYMKMENMQITGSFKIRGVVNQMRQVRERHGKNSKLVTMSAGNYGKAFAHCVGNSGIKSVCIMPETAPQNRVTLIEHMGVQVKKVPTTEIQSEVDRLVSENFVFCHPFDDVDLIAGYGSSALELLEDVPNPDIVIVCCGGGGFVSGVSAGIKLSGLKNCRIYAVEPEGAPTMFKSFEERRPVTLGTVKSVAAGLAPPYAGTLCYRHCRWFVEDIILVSDEEILHAMRTLFHCGIKAEPSGCAAMAALLTGKIPDTEGKKVVVYVTGGNVSAAELSVLIPEGS